MCCNVLLFPGISDLLSLTLGGPDACSTGLGFVRCDNILAQRELFTNL